MVMPKGPNLLFDRRASTGLAGPWLVRCAGKLSSRPTPREQLIHASRGKIRADVGHDKLVGEEQEDREAVRPRLGKTAGGRLSRPHLRGSFVLVRHERSRHTEKRESTMTSLAHRGFVHLGMDVSRDSIS